MCLDLRLGMMDARPFVVWGPIGVLGLMRWNAGHGRSTDDPSLTEQWTFLGAGIYGISYVSGQTPWSLPCSKILIADNAANKPGRWRASCWQESSSNIDGLTRTWIPEATVLLDMNWIYTAIDCLFAIWMYVSERDG